MRVEPDEDIRHSQLPSVEAGGHREKLAGGRVGGGIDGASCVAVADGDTSGAVGEDTDDVDSVWGDVNDCMVQALGRAAISSPTKICV